MFRLTKGLIGTGQPVCKHLAPRSSFDFDHWSVVEPEPAIHSKLAGFLMAEAILRCCQGHFLEHCHLGRRESLVT